MAFLRNNKKKVVYTYETEFSIAIKKESKGRKRFKNVNYMGERKAEHKILLL